MNKKNTFAPHAIPKTLSQSIYYHLKDAIINNKLKSNQKINEKEIAQLFEVSTTPVREAVLRLGAEGFVTMNSHREAVVKEISYEELREILQVLSILDSSATCLAVDNLSAETLEELEHLTKEMEKSCHIHSIEKYMTLNLDIHKKIWENIPTRFLQANLHYANDQMLRYNYARFYAFRKSGALERSIKEHKEMLDALKNKDKKRLKNLMAKHWGSLLQPSHFEEGLKEYLNNERKEVKIGENIKTQGNTKGSIT